jgi:hypothetical protein
LVFPGAFPSIADDVHPEQLLSSSTITLKAGIYSGDEDQEYVAVPRTIFYLLDKSAASILREARFEFDSIEQPVDDESFLKAASLAFTSSERKDAEFIAALVIAELAKHQKAKFITDASGKAHKKTLKPGSYYLFGFARSSSNEILIWNLPVKIKPGMNKIELDQYNAETVFLIKE